MVMGRLRVGNAHSKSEFTNDLSFFLREVEGANGSGTRHCVRMTAAATRVRVGHGQFILFEVKRTRPQDDGVFDVMAPLFGLNI